MKTSQIIVSNPDLDRIRIQSGQKTRIRIRNPDPDPGGQKWPTKIEKVRNLMSSSAGYSILKAESFSCSLDVLYGGLGTNKLQFLIKKEF